VEITIIEKNVPTVVVILEDFLEYFHAVRSDTWPTSGRNEIGRGSGSWEERIVHG
jgi:hypothetical protein